ncbi:hypothetical protein EMIT0210MI2_10069 [Priestia megaterium]
MVLILLHFLFFVYIGVRPTQVSIMLHIVIIRDPLTLVWDIR